MWTLLAIVIMFGSGFAIGWSIGSKDGFDKAVEQLDKIIASVNRQNRS